MLAGYYFKILTMPAQNINPAHLVLNENAKKNMEKLFSVSMAQKTKLKKYL